MVMTKSRTQSEHPEENGASSNDKVEAPPEKRLKHSNDNGIAPENKNVMGAISSHVLLEEEKLRDAYSTAKPYPHGRIENLFVDGFLEKVLDEVKQHSKVKFKESDLFRVYQSIDLGNLNEDSPEAQHMPLLLELKAAIYSPIYRAFVERINHLDPGVLTEQVDCAANCHAPGCHLLCHDDVIGTRKISYIIYLTDPNQSSPWERNEGGCLELYGATQVEEGRREPQTFPCKTILPTFNTMAYFEVKPGVSFHAVQEVLGGRPRLSIQGWYHAKDAPEQIADATLNRLKSTAKGEDTEGSFTPLMTNNESEEVTAAITTGAADSDGNHPSVGALSESDRIYLSKYINDTYLMDESIQEIRQRFEEESSVQLRDFLRTEWLDKVCRLTSELDDTCGLGRRNKGRSLFSQSTYEAGVDSDWKAVGPPHKQRFLEFVGNTTGTQERNTPESPGKILGHLKMSIFESAAFGRLLGLLTSLGSPSGYRGKCRRFRPGLDYTVAHYGILTNKSVLDATLCFAAGNGKQCHYDKETGDLIGNDDDALWESGDYGGFECYIAAEDDDNGENQQGPADEYNDEDDTELLSVSASNNTLSLVYRDPGTMRFVKYVGSGAPSSRWDISMEYQVEEAYSDDDDIVDTSAVADSG